MRSISVLVVIKKQNKKKLREKINKSLLNQLRQKADEIEYAILTDYDRDQALNLSRLSEIVDKQQLNNNYPSPDFCRQNINELLIKNL